MVPISLWPGLVGSFSSEQILVPVRLSFDHNSAQISFRLSSDQVQRSSGSDLVQVLIHLSSGSDLDQVTLISGSDSGPSRCSSDQVQTQLNTNSCECQLTQSCQVCRMPEVGPQLVPIALVLGKVGSLSSEQSQVLDRLSFVQNSAQIRFRLSSEHLRLSSSPDPD